MRPRRRRLPAGCRLPAAAVCNAAPTPASCRACRRMAEEWWARLRDLALISRLAAQLYSYLGMGALLAPAGQQGAADVRAEPSGSAPASCGPPPARLVHAAARQPTHPALPCCARGPPARLALERRLLAPGALRGPAAARLPADGASWRGGAEGSSNARSPGPPTPALHSTTPCIQPSALPRMPLPLIRWPSTSCRPACCARCPTGPRRGQAGASRGARLACVPIAWPPRAPWPTSHGWVPAPHHLLPPPSRSPATGWTCTCRAASGGARGRAPRSSSSLAARGPLATRVGWGAWVVARVSAARAQEGRRGPSGAAFMRASPVAAAPHTAQPGARCWRGG